MANLHGGAIAQYLDRSGGCPADIEQAFECCNEDRRTQIRWRIGGPDEGVHGSSMPAVLNSATQVADWE